MATAPIDTLKHTPPPSSLREVASLFARRETPFEEPQIYEGTWEVENHEMNYRFIRGGANPHMTLMFAAGFRGKGLEYDSWIENMASEGCNMILTELPDVGNNTDFIHLYDRVVSDFFASDRSPVYRHFEPLPMIGMAHSTAGLCLQRVFHDAAVRESAEHRLNGIINVSPFFNNAGSETFLGRFLYRGHARRNSDVPAGSHIVDKIYCRLTRSTGYMTDPPTHGQINHLVEAGEELRKQGLAETSFPQALYMSKNDPFSSAKAAIKLCEPAGHHICMITGKDLTHSPVLDDLDFGSNIISIMEAIARGDIEPPREKVASDKRSRIAEEREHSSPGHIAPAIAN